jgi:dimethylhistidine N-methyltransferase
MVTHTAISSEAGLLAADIRAGLSKAGQKELPSKYLYDTLGSLLFDAICELPEYGLTRADERLLRAHSAEIATMLPGNIVACELGSGNGRKTRWILEALSRRRHVQYYPIEISASALAHCRRELADIDSVGIVGLEKEYLDGLLVVASRRAAGQRILVLFLGSTIGNFTAPADQRFLADIRRLLLPGDALLLGTDLDKPAWQLIDAYDDPTGVTAAFNLNLLARINRELGANFNLRNFRHAARYDMVTRNVEMHIVSEMEQTVEIPAVDLTVGFSEGESIWTESSHKYVLTEIYGHAASAGFSCAAQWVDHEWPFAESLLFAV